MPFARPTPQQIRDRVSSEIVRVTGGTAAMLRRSVEWVLARMVAVASHEMHGHLAWTARQVLVDQADVEELDRHAGIWGIERSPAARAHGVVGFAGVPGSLVPAGTELRRSDDVRYLTNLPTVLGPDGSAVVACTALQAGAIGNAIGRLGLQVISPIAGVVSPVTVSPAGLAGGVDGEDDASFRARIIARIQEPPHGGARHDYGAWVRGVVGDTRAWVYPKQLGVGTVIVAFIMPDGSMPSPATVAAVQEHVDEERPVTAEVTVIAPVVEPLAVRLRILPDTAFVRATVLAELEAMIIREAEPGGLLPLSRISSAISAAAGEYSHSLLAPVADVQVSFGRITRLGAVTWVVS